MLILGSLTAGSIVILQSVYIFYLLRKFRQIKRRGKSFEAEELLSDILSGGSLVRIQRIAPENVLLRIAERHR